LFGGSPPIRCRTHAYTADFVNGMGELMAPFTCAAEPVKSAVRWSPAIVTVTTIGIGSGSIPSSSM
jgi:hypothetical protein